METINKRVKAVRLRNEHKTYLVADDDGETISQRHNCFPAKNLCWFVEFVDKKPGVIRLKSCQSGKYLGASIDPSAHGVIEKRVVQCSSQTRPDHSVLWLPDKASGSNCIRLRTPAGSILRANHDHSDDMPSTNPFSFLAASRSYEYGVLWGVDVLEFGHESTDKEMLRKNSGSSSLNKEPGEFEDWIEFTALGDEGTSYFFTQTGPLNRNRWNILVLVIKAKFKLRFLLKEAYKRPEKMKLHCCLFPENYEFDGDTMVQLWMAAGYLRKEPMEEYGKRYFDILVNEGFIVLSRFDILSEERKYIINLYKFTDHFKRTFINKEENLYTILNDEHGEGTESCHVSLMSNDINRTTLETLKRFNELRTLLFICKEGPCPKHLPPDMFLGLPCMEALDLSDIHISELPGSIGNMRQLRYLNLSCTVIESLPETISRLNELQTLNLRGCKKLFSLPKGFNKLVKLRHLYFDVLGQLSFMPRGIGALTELRTLSAFIVDIEKGCNIKELRYMNNLHGSCCISGLENVTLQDAMEAALKDKVHLTRLKLRWNDYGVSDLDVLNLEPHSCLEELTMLSYPRSKFPKWICDEKFKQLNCITLRKCAVSELDVCLGRLPNLKCLDIAQMDRVKKIGHSIHGYPRHVSFPRLEKLTIDGMFSLVGWIDVERGDFPLLSKFSIKNCPKLNLFPFLSLLVSLKLLEIGDCPLLKCLSDQKLPDNLETLMIDDCPSLNERYSKEEEEWNKIKHVPHIWFDLEEMLSPFDGDDFDTQVDYEGRLRVEYDAQPEIDIVDVYDQPSIPVCTESSLIDEEEFLLPEFDPLAKEELPKAIENIDRDDEVQKMKQLTRTISDLDERGERLRMWLQSVAPKQQEIPQINQRYSKKGSEWDIIKNVPPHKNLDLEEEMHSTPLDGADYDMKDDGDSQKDSVHVSEKPRLPVYIDTMRRKFKKMTTHWQRNTCLVNQELPKTIDNKERDDYAKKIEQLNKTVEGLKEREERLQMQLFMFSSIK